MTINNDPKFIIKSGGRMMANIPRSGLRDALKRTFDRSAQPELQVEIYKFYGPKLRTERALQKVVKVGFLWKVVEMSIHNMDPLQMEDGRWEHVSKTNIFS